ncbi:MAG: substrate-binding domain-containing protein, partial [Geminicoccaceae bacterium]|nr:substrate-binding domain-containing protein [Geminicoccaceae bacterium]
EDRDGATRPTAVFSLSQHSTLLVLSEIRRMGLSMPEDIALVGFDDTDWMQITWPSITSVAQPVATIAERAAGVLFARIEGKSTGFPVQYLEPCTMLVRQSAGPEQHRTPRRSGRSGQA